MNNQEILTTAIEKAIAGGFVPWFDWPHSGYFEDGFYSPGYDGDHLDLGIEELIFDHAFAKALWGENENHRKVIVGETDWRKWPLDWHHHLQQMVIAKDPIEYLGHNI